MKHITPRCRPIHQEALEMIADVLLASSPKDNERPTYNERHLGRKCRRTAQEEISFAILTHEARILGEKEAEIITSRLTPRQRLVWSMHADGYSPSEIADALGITRPTVVRILRNAAGSIAKARTTFRGLREVYRAEIHRGAYRKPHHCLEGQCTRLGYCKYALRR